MTTGAAVKTESGKDRLGDPLPAGALQRLGTTRMNYDKAVSFAYLPEDRAAVAGGNRLDIWDLANGVRVAGYEPGPAALQALACSADGRRIVLADAAGEVAVWDPIQGRELRRWATGQEGLVHLCLSPDEQRVLTIGRLPATIKEWELATGRELIAIRGPLESYFMTQPHLLTGGELIRLDTPIVFAMAIYGPDGKTALVGDAAQASMLHYDLRTGQQIHPWYPDIYPRKLALSPDGKRLLIGSRHRATEWDLDGYRFLRAFEGHHGHEATAVAYCREPDQILTGSRDGSIRRWNRVNGEVLLRWVAHQSYVAGLAVAPDGKRVLSFGAGALVESDLRTGKPRLAWDRHCAPVLATALLPLGDRAASSSADGTIRLWETDTGKTLRQWALPAESLSAYALAVDPSGTRLAAGGYRNIVEFSAADGNPRRTLSGHRGFVRALGYTPDGSRLLSAADDGSILVWTATQTEPSVRLEGHRGGVLALAAAPDGSQLLSGGRDGTVRLWDLANGSLLQTLEGHRGWVEAVQFQGDGDHALSAGRDGRILRWDLRKGQVTGEMTSGTWLHALACPPAGKIAFSAGEDGAMIAWDLRTGRKRREFPGHSGAVRTLTISGDGQRLVSGSDDTTLLVWSASEMNGRKQ